MKKIEMTAKEFYTFKELSRKSNLTFDFSVKKGIITVKADEKKLNEWGYGSN